jgi:hypothetical protein
MTSNSDDLEEVLQQNIKLRRELGAMVAKARNLVNQSDRFHGRLAYAWNLYPDRRTPL